MTEVHEPFRQRHVLLIADDPAFLAHTVYALAQAGHRVTVARDEAAAMPLVTQEGGEGDPFDLLLIDVDLPGMTGFALLRQVRCLKLSTPVLILTNFLDSARYQEVRRMTCPDIVLKSRVPAELLRYLEQLNADRLAP